jgi:lipopolysaccharide/colanic/teichoic acid biosynthesis glycosyltransferase
MSSLLLTEVSETTNFNASANVTSNHSSLWVTSRLRRCLDCCVATVALVCSSPLLLIAALAVRLSSPGPLLFRQQRAGRYGHTFTLYKFRSMRVGNPGGSPLTIMGDPRVTPAGRLLRRFKLDELPQLWNVLRGDMALVGPRPKLPQHEGLHLLWRPGLTGAATLAFRDEEEILAKIPAKKLEYVYDTLIKPAKARLDSEYMSSATLASDIGILRKTLASCLMPCKSAHTFSGEFLERPLSCRTLCLLDRAMPDASAWKSPRPSKYAA